jgi:hypothetical protein
MTNCNLFINSLIKYIDTSINNTIECIQNDKKNEINQTSNINFFLTYVSNQVSVLENSTCSKDFTNKNIKVYLHFHNTILKNYLENNTLHIYDSLGALSNLNLHLKNINQKLNDKT